MAARCVFLVFFCSPQSLCLFHRRDWKDPPIEIQGMVQEVSKNIATGSTKNHVFHTWNQDDQKWPSFLCLGRTPTSSAFRCRNRDIGERVNRLNRTSETSITSSQKHIATGKYRNWLISETWQERLQESIDQWLGFPWTCPLNPILG